MLKHGKYTLKAISFTLLMVVVVVYVNNILVPKKYFDNMWPTTTTYKGFYQMQPGTVDVLFFGSSHAASGFNPQIVYNNWYFGHFHMNMEINGKVSALYEEVKIIDVL